MARAKTRSRWGFRAAGIAAWVVLAGCAEHKASAPVVRTAADAQADGAAAADILEHHRQHHHGGTLMLVAMSLDDLGLSPEEQARVEQIQADLLAKMRPAAEIEKGLDTSLAEGIAASALDAANIDKTLDALAVSSASAHASAGTDLDQLHALLTPPQRAAFIDKLDAEWALWKRANVGDQSHVVILSQKIGLWPGQIGKIREELASAEAAAPLREAEIERHLHEFERAFQADGFDAKSLSSAGAVTGHVAEWGAARLAKFCEAINPLLVPEQRDKLVALLREHASHDETRRKD